MSTQKQTRVRTAAAWICLLAVILLYAPLAGAALLAHGADCCAGGYCTIPEHHHHKPQGHEKQGAPSQSSSTTDCGHAMGGMTPCKLSCCQDPARPALIPGAFLLPPVSFRPAAGETVRPVQVTKSFELSRFEKPLSPPPRIISPVL